MSLHPQSKQLRDPNDFRQHHHPEHFPHDEELFMKIPQVIIVPKRPCRITSTMQQHYQELSNGRPSPPQTATSKPWKVDMAQKSYITRRFRRPTRRQRATLASALAPSPPSFSPNTSDISNNNNNMAPELDGSWNRDDDDITGYPSDEEHGFGGSSASGSGGSGRRTSSRNSPNNSSASIGQYRRYHGLQAFRASPVYQRV